MKTVKNTDNSARNHNMQSLFKSFNNCHLRMKTGMILSAFLIFASLQAFAQDSNRESTSAPAKKHKFWIGPKFGFDMSPVTFKFNDIKNQLNMNYQAGILLQYGRTIYIQPEVYYSSYKITAENSETSSSVNFIKVPAMLGLRFLNLGLFSLHVMGGPAFSFQLKDNDAFSGNNTFSWQVGAGVDLLGFITTDVRYTLREGVSIADQVSQFDKETSTLNVTVGLKIR